MLAIFQHSFGQKVQATVASGAHLILSTNWAAFASGVISVEHLDGTNKRIYSGPFNFNPNAINIPGLDTDYAQNTPVLVYVVKPLIKVISAPGISATVSSVNHLVASTDWTKYATQKILVEEADGRNQHIYPASSGRDYNPNAMKVIGLDQDFAEGTVVNIYAVDHAILSREGNVSINTSNFDNQLSVKGKMRAQEIKVENTNWPDYVFHKSYQLPTLLETEKHIKEKGHLPGIPSAAEVKANGIDLGEMNAKLLQKIEEVTLHLIELEKKNELQQKEIDTFKLKRKRL